MVIMKSASVKKLKIAFASCMMVGVSAMSLPAEVNASTSGEPTVPLKVGHYVSPFGHYLAALHAEREARFSLAARLLSVTMQRESNNTLLMDNKHQWLVTEGLYEQAVPLANSLLEINPGSTFGQRTLFLTAVKDDDWATAQNFLPEYPERGLDAFLVPLQTAWVLSRKGETSQAIDALERLMSEPSLRPAGLTMAGLIYAQAEDYDKAIESLETALAIYEVPSDRLVDIAGSVYRKAGKNRDAQQLYSSYLEKSPRNGLIKRRLAGLEAGLDIDDLIVTPAAGLAEGFHGIARVVYRDRVDPLSLTLVNAAHYLAPAEPTYIFLLGQMLSSEKRYDAAMEVYRKIRPDMPANRMAKLVMASTLSDAGRVDESVAMLQQLADENPDQLDAKIQLANILRRNERYEESAETYDDIVLRLENPSRADWRTFYHRGIAHEQSKNWPTAEDSLKKALELNPEHPLVLNYLGYSWADKKINLDEALGMLNRAVEQQPDDGYIVDSLGWVLFQLNRIDEALPHLERAVELLPGDPVINDHVGDAYWKIGRNREAMFQWRRALSFSPIEEDKIKISAKLDQESTKSNASE
jgi:tetratricopeptide (TPR) repeat protein